MSDYPSTDRFFVVRDLKREPNDRVLEVMYRPTLNVPAREFAHVWDIRGWEPEDEGKWTFNRGPVCFDNKWWISIRTHDTLAALLDHLEETFVEGVPANVPA